MYSSPKAVIFDLDGTLLNTIEDIADSCNHALTLQGHPVHPTSDYCYFVGNGIVSLARAILPISQRTEDNINTCVSLISNHYDGNWKSKTAIYPGVMDLLQSLTGKDIPINILSNKNEDTVQTMVAYYFGDLHFNHILGTVDHARKKPHPGRALAIAQSLQLQPADIMFIGDSKVDMQTAQNSGMISVGVTWGFRSRQELQDHDAQIIIDTPMELWDSINP